MLSAIDILAIIKGEEAYPIKQLAEKLEITTQQLKKIIKDLSEHNIVEYNEQTEQVKLPLWLVNIERQAESIKAATGTIILPKNQEIKIQDFTIGNFTEKDIELNIRLKANLKEIAICNMK
jgi:transcription initiation factor IIE alpha subunit